MSGNCDYYKAKNPKEIVNCPNCIHWLGQKCKIEDQVKRNDKTDLIHEPVYGGYQHRRVTGTLR